MRFPEVSPLFSRKVRPLDVILGKALRHAWWLVPCFVAIVETLEARAGGGGGYRSSGGGSSSGGGYRSSGSSGGGDGLLFELLFRLVFHYPMVGIPLVIGVAYFLYYKGREGMEEHVSHQIQRGLVAQKKVTRSQATAALRSRDPQFSETEFLERARKAFLQIQHGWCEQNLARVQAFISDGVFERFSLQIAEQKAHGFHDKMSNLTIHDCQIAQLESDSHFDTIHVYFRASAVDVKADRATGRHVGGSGQNEFFEEYWSFLRKPDAKTLKKPGLIEGFCPNCGAPIELGQIAQCPMCNSFLRSGEYDWVLSEITQSCEWSVQEKQTIPGLAEINAKDPGFNVQHIEDKTSVIFWRRVTADRLGNVAPIRKMALESYCTQFAAGLVPGPNRERSFIAECAVGSSSVRAVAQGNDFDRVYVEIRWSGKPHVIDGNGVIKPSSKHFLSRHSVFVLARQSARQTDIRTSLISSHCPNCGAPESAVESVMCEYCNTVLNDGSREWVLEKIISPGDQELQELLRQAVPAQMRPVGIPVGLSAGSLSTAVAPSVFPIPAADALAWMVRVMLADGVIHDKEMAMLKEFASSYQVPVEKLEGIIATAKAGELPMVIPEEREQRMALMNVIVGMALADGRLAPEEIEVLNEVGAKMGFSQYDLKLLINKEKNRLYTLAKEALRAERRLPPVS